MRIRQLGKYSCKCEFCRFYKTVTEIVRRPFAQIPSQGRFMSRLIQAHVFCHVIKASPLFVPYQRQRERGCKARQTENGVTRRRRLCKVWCNFFFERWEKMPPPITLLSGNNVLAEASANDVCRRSCIRRIGSNFVLITFI